MYTHSTQPTTSTNTCVMCYRHSTHSQDNGQLLAFFHCRSRHDSLKVKRYERRLLRCLCMHPHEIENRIANTSAATNQMPTQADVDASIHTNSLLSFQMCMCVCIKVVHGSVMWMRHIRCHSRHRIGCSPMRFVYVLVRVYAKQAMLIGFGSLYMYTCADQAKLNEIFHSFDCQRQNGVDSCQILCKRGN